MEAGATPSRGGEEGSWGRLGDLIISGGIVWQAIGLLNLLLSILALLNSLESSSADVGRMSLRRTPTRRLNCKAQTAFLQDAV